MPRPVGCWPGPTQTRIPRETWPAGSTVAGGAVRTPRASRHRRTRAPPPAAQLGWRPPVERVRRPRPGGWCWPRPGTSCRRPGDRVRLRTVADAVVGSSRPGRPPRPGDLVTLQHGSSSLDPSGAWWWAHAESTGGPGRRGARPLVRARPRPGGRERGRTPAAAGGRRGRVPALAQVPARRAGLRAPGRPGRLPAASARDPCRDRPPAPSRAVRRHCSHPTSRPAPDGWCRGSPRPRTRGRASPRRRISYGQLRCSSGGRSGGPARGTSGLRPIAHRRPGPAGPGCATRSRRCSDRDRVRRRHRRHRVRRRGPPPRRTAAVPGRTWPGRRTRLVRGRRRPGPLDRSNGSSSATGGWTTGCSPGGPASPPPSPSAPACPAADRNGRTWPPEPSARLFEVPSRRRRRPAGSAGRVAGSARPGPPAWWVAGPATRTWSRPDAAWPGALSGLSPTSPGGARTTPTCSTAGPVTWLPCRRRVHPALEPTRRTAAAVLLQRLLPYADRRPHGPRLLR